MLRLALALLTASADSAVVRDIEVAPGAALRTTSVGTGQPLVLIPGPLVARGYQCIIVEPLGYGWSSHPKEKAFSFGGLRAKLAADESKLRHDVRREIIRDKEQESLANRLHGCAVPVRLLAGTVPHPAEVPR